MIQTAFIEDIVKKIDNLLPDDIKTMQKDFSNNLKLVLTASLKKANLVTREEFEVQKSVLLKTRNKLEELEKQLESLK